jgi:hypothetical protein
MNEWTCEPRPLTPDESESLDCLLRADFPGVDVLREQAEKARVVGGCGCGCPTVNLEVDLRRSRRADPGRGVLSAWVLDDEGAALLLFVREGKLSGLEISWMDEPPKSFPACDQLATPVWQPDL